MDSERLNAFRKWTGNLAAYYGESPLSESAMQFWWDQLKRFPPDVMEAGFKRAMRECRTMPTLSIVEADCSEASAAHKSREWEAPGPDGKIYPKRDLDPKAQKRADVLMEILTNKISKREGQEKMDRIERGEE